MYRFGLMVKQQDYQIGKKMLFSCEIGILSEKDYQIGILWEKQYQKEKNKWNTSLPSQL